MDHKTIAELHGLSTLASEFAGDDNFSALSARLHHIAEYTVTSPKKKLELDNEEKRQNTDF